MTTAREKSDSEKPEKDEPRLKPDDEVIKRIARHLRTQEDINKAFSTLDENVLIGEVLLGDKLDPETAKMRRSLLATSLGIVAATKGGMLPSTIPALNVTLETTNQSALVWLGGVVLAYFTAMFAVRIKARKQLMTRHVAVSKKLIELIGRPDVAQSIVKRSSPTEISMFRFRLYLWKHYRETYVVSIATEFLEIVFPLLGAAIAFWCLFGFTPS